ARGAVGGSSEAPLFAVGVGGQRDLFFFQAEDGIRDFHVTGVQTCALPIYPCALDMMSMRVHAHVPQELDLERHGFEMIELAPGYVYLHPDGSSLVFWRDRLKTAAEIRRYSTEDADAFLEFMSVVDMFLEIALPMMRVDPAKLNLTTKLIVVGSALKNRKLKPELMALMTGSAHQAARERFEHPVTISAMCALTGLAGDITADGGGIYYALLGFLHRFGVGRVRGG